MMNQFGYPQGMQGMVPNQVAMPKTGNWLSADKYALLQKGLGQFKMSVSDEEVARGQCNHYNLNGTSALVRDPNDGSYTCTICGTKFTACEFTQEDVDNATKNVLDILNTIKVMYLSLDPSAALEYFQIIPFIEKIPQLYQIAVNDFKKYEGINSFMPTQQNPFNFYAMLMGQAPMAPGMGYAQAPMGYAAQPVAPMGYAPQPVMNGFAQQNPGFNPLYGTPVPQPGYQPAAQGFAFNPQGAAQPMVNTNMPVQPQAAPAADQVKVDTEFKK